MKLIVFVFVMMISVACSEQAWSKQDFVKDLAQRSRSLENSKPRVASQVGPKEVMAAAKNEIKEKEAKLKQGLKALEAADDLIPNAEQEVKEATERFYHGQDQLTGAMDDPNPEPLHRPEAIF